MKYFITLLSSLVFLSSIAQSVAIKKIELAGENVNVYYDLDDSNPNNEYQLKLYTSRDNYSVPLTKVSGDIGEEIKPGTDKKVSWKIMEEYGSYKGKLTLEIRGKVFIPFVKLRDFDEKKTYKRGKGYTLNWKPGNTNPIHIELYKGSKRVGGELNHPNNGTYTLSIPDKVKPGKDYRIKITDSKIGDEIIYSGYFKVSPRVPGPLKIIPILAAAGGIAVLIGGGGETPTDGVGIIQLPPLPSGN